MHLGVEGGVGERRTTPSIATLDPATDAHDNGSLKQGRTAKTALPAVEVTLEDMGPVDAGDKAKEGLDVKPKKAKKQVAFQADRPDW